jgi:hypothetical protein
VPLPVAGAPAGAGAAALTPIGGADFCAEELGRVSKETGKKLESEVLAPMERWLNAFALVHTRMRKLEALRLEVDSRRRTVARLGRRVDAQRAGLPATRARGEFDMENTVKALQHKESKLSACRQSYKEHEALVYHQLTNLIRDTVWLKSYLSAVLRVEAEALAVANVALGPTKAALPGALAPGGAAEGPAGHAVSAGGASSAPASPGGIAAARSDGAPLPRKSLAREGGVSLVATAATGSAGGLKDSLYTVDEAAGGGGGAYDRYGAAADSGAYSRAPVPAW